MDLSVGIVSWNTKEHLSRCLRSLETEMAGLEAEIIVVDNASTDGSPEMVAAGFSGVQLIRNHENVGYSKACNQAIALATGSHVLLLNSDMLVCPGAIAAMISFMECQPDCGAVGPQLILPDGSPQPYSFGEDPTLWYLIKRGLNRTVFRRYLHKWDDPRAQAVDWISGACLMLRRNALDEAGWLDEKFFMYFEDNDLCLRLRKKGWKVCRFPQARVMHHVGKSLEQNPTGGPAYYQSLVYFYSKHYGRLSHAVLSTAIRHRKSFFWLLRVARVRGHGAGRNVGIVSF